jgi:hypothetical protein
MTCCLLLCAHKHPERIFTKQDSTSLQHGKEVVFLIQFNRFYDENCVILCGSYDETHVIPMAFVMKFVLFLLKGTLLCLKYTVLLLNFVQT